mgnify:CR=1 FL=1
MVIPMQSQSFNGTLDALFDPEPRTWGTRGNPYLWRAMKSRSTGIGMPDSTNELVLVIAEVFLDLTGRPISTEKMFFVQEFAHGGMSSGFISPDYWRSDLLPELVTRYQKLTRRRS